MELEKAHYNQLDEPLPKVLSEKIEQIHTLEDSIMVSTLVHLVYVIISHYTGVELFENICFVNKKL